MSPRADLVRFYEILTALEAEVGAKRWLAECDGRMTWPQRGVYFFFEPGESRSDTGDGMRVVRVGTHALRPGARTTLWGRLSQHRGTKKTGGGNCQSASKTDPLSASNVDPPRMVFQCFSLLAVLVLIRQLSLPVSMISQ
jgi:hypothetical protein